MFCLIYHESHTFTSQQIILHATLLCSTKCEGVFLSIPVILCFPIITVGMKINMEALENLLDLCYPSQWAPGPHLFLSKLCYYFALLTLQINLHWNCIIKQRLCNSYKMNADLLFDVMITHLGPAYWFRCRPEIKAVSVWNTNISKRPAKLLKQTWSTVRAALHETLSTSAGSNGRLVGIYQWTPQLSAFSLILNSLGSPLNSLYATRPATNSRHAEFPECSIYQLESQILWMLM